MSDDVRRPDLKGKRGEAWLLTPPEPLPALLRVFLVHAPGYHLLWSWYLVSLVHLRAAPGLPVPVKNYPEAEFELVVQALDPGADLNNPRAWDPDRDWPFERLTPPNIVEQFHGLPENGARILADRLVVAVTRGMLSPDSDFRKSWTTAIEKATRGLKAVQPRETPEA